VDSPSFPIDPSNITTSSSKNARSITHTFFASVRAIARGKTILVEDRLASICERSGSPETFFSFATDHVAQIKRERVANPSREIDRQE
jgi:hypothetical protein